MCRKVVVKHSINPDPVVDARVILQMNTIHVSSAVALCATQIHTLYHAQIKLILVHVCTFFIVYTHTLERPNKLPIVRVLYGDAVFM